VSPCIEQIIPFAPEAITLQDGCSKNDCERNAARRFFQDFRKEYPRLKAIVLYDALVTDTPFIKELKGFNLSFILVAKPGKCPFVIDAFEKAKIENKTKTSTVKKDGVRHVFEWINELTFSEEKKNSNSEVLVNYLQYTEVENEKCTAHWVWVTDILITPENAFDIMLAARSRWSIENKGFNQVKNNDQKFEHNFGHGNKNLVTNFLILQILALLLQELVGLTCKFFTLAKKLWQGRNQVWIAFKDIIQSTAAVSFIYIFNVLAGKKHGMTTGPPV
jgi:hypothetical protein